MIFFRKLKRILSHKESRQALFILIGITCAGLAAICLVFMLLFRFATGKITGTDPLASGSSTISAGSASVTEANVLQSTGQGAVERTERSEATETTDCTDITAPAETTGSTDITEPAETAVSTETTGTTDMTEPTETADSTETAGFSMNDFYISEITDEIFARISGISYPEGCTLPLSSLRYVHVLHIDFEGNTVTGELIVNEKIAADVLEIFKELYEIRYPIEKMVLVDAYGGDDELSMEDNNSSAFNYRTIAESTVLSNHALGLAIDINPLYNPYVYVRKDGSTFLQPYNAGEYVDRTTGNPYYILPDDECCRIFKAHGFSWGGDWQTKKDYQHFEYVE